MGSRATPEEVAEALGIGVPALRQFFTAREWSAWEIILRRIRRETRLAEAAAVVVAKAKELGYVPTALESGLSHHTRVKCGGYREIVKAAGGVAKLGRRTGKTPKARPRRAAPAAPVPTPPPAATKVRHWQEVKG